MTPLPRNYTAQAQAQAQVGGGFRSRELLPGQTAADRPDLVPRVFKLDALLTDLWSTGIFGHVLAQVHTVRVPLDYL